MKINVATIRLSDTAPTERLVKRGALSTFRLLRAAGRRSQVLGSA